MRLAVERLVHEVLRVVDAGASRINYVCREFHRAVAVSVIAQGVRAVQAAAAVADSAALDVVCVRG